MKKNNKELTISVKDMHAILFDCCDSLCETTEMVEECVVDFYYMEKALLEASSLSEAEVSKILNKIVTKPLNRNI